MSSRSRCWELSRSLEDHRSRGKRRPDITDFKMLVDWAKKEPKMSLNLNLIRSFSMFAVPRSCSWYLIACRWPSRPLPAAPGLGVIEGPSFPATVFCNVCTVHPLGEVDPESSAHPSPW